MKPSLPMDRAKSCSIPIVRSRCARQNQFQFLRTPILWANILCFLRIDIKQLRYFVLNICIFDIVDVSTTKHRTYYVKRFIYEHIVV